MKVLLLGISGYLGNIIYDELKEEYDVWGCDLVNLNIPNFFFCDLSDVKGLVSLAERINPDIVICAAGTKDLVFCERNPKLAEKINSKTIANVCKVFNEKKILYLSTDYVFDGFIGNYSEDDIPNPLTVYGKTKYRGEKNGFQITGKNFYVFRISAVYSAKATFVRFLYDNLKQNSSVRCYSDVLYTPTYYKDLQVAIKKWINAKKIDQNIFHVCGNAITRYDFAKKFARIFGFNDSLVLNDIAAGKEKFLYPNLSMQNIQTSKILDLRTSHVDDALEQLRFEIT